MEKSLQHSCLEDSMKSMKRQNDRTLKDELPRSVGAQYDTGEEWRNSSRRNKEVEPKWRDAQLWMCLVVKVKSKDKVSIIMFTKRFNNVHYNYIP